MEIDILNDLLNRTISNLFTNKEKHLSYFSAEDDEYLSDDMKVKNEKDLSHTQVFEHGTFENIIGKNHHQHQIMNPIIEEKKELKEQNITPEIWRNTIGKKKFENAMHRLNIDEKKIKNLQLSNLSLDALQKEKAKVKNELKKYDSDFNEIFNYLPTKQDKEIMKPLYIYYKSIKNAIEKKEGNNDGNSVMNNPRYSQITYSVVSNNSDTGNIKNNNNYHQHLNNQNNNQKNNFNYHKKANSSSIQNKNEIQDVVKEKKRSLSKDEINALEREYKDIKKEQKDLKDMLRNYQNEFQKSNNRKVKFLKDITPVEREYQKYKSNRQRLNDIMEIIESNKKK